jgi:HPt (histidine-containing phosphotransfer) domain-containing protein
MVDLASQVPDSSDVFDAPAMLRRMHDDHEFVVELLEMFLDVFPEMLAEVRNAVDLRDSGRLRESAHRLVGALSQIHAPAASEAARLLENDGRHGQVLHTTPHFDRLQSEVERLCTLLESLLNEQSPIPGR